jgi:hypothetical protein
MKVFTAVLLAATCFSAMAQTSTSIDDKIDALQKQIDELKAANDQLKTTVVDNQASTNAAIDSPSTLHYKGIEITPIGFFAAESFYRQRSLNSDINTPFNSTLFPGAAQYYTSEWGESARQSRLGLLVQGHLANATLTGYFEGDFLGAGTTSNDNQSNSYVFRQRQFFGQVAFHNGFTVTGGQTWSLVTEDKTGTDARSEVLPTTPDAQYHVGFSWARQPGIRLQQKMGKATYALGIESGENIFSVSNANQNFFFGNAGTGGGLLNATANYSNNVAPDFILKAAYDSKYGHFEIGGILRFFRDRYYPGVTSTTSVPANTLGNPANKTIPGGGFFFNAHVPMTKYFTLGVHGMEGPGVGRYGTVGLPDTTVHPDGTLATIKSTQGLLSLEFHPLKQLDIFGYGGGEYAQRTVYYTGTKYVGYAPITNNVSGCYTEYTPTSATGYGPAAATNCSAATRAVLEGTVSVVYRFYNGPKGRVQANVAYSYLQRNAWGGTVSAGVYSSPAGNNNMVFTGLRYYIP